MRDIKTDKAIEQCFGKPDWEHSFVKAGMLWTRMGNYKLWRIDAMATGETRGAKFPDEA